LEGVTGGDVNVGPGGRHFVGPSTTADRSGTCSKTVHSHLAFCGIA
jgi:hypothetical protein